MTSDELKGLRLRRTQLTAELHRIELILNPPERRSKPMLREQFYRDAENDFKDCDSNGNYGAHDPGDEDPKAWDDEEKA